MTLDIIFLCRKFNKHSIKYQPHLKVRKIDASGQEICLCHNHNYHHLTLFYGLLVHVSPVTASSLLLSELYSRIPLFYLFL